MILIHSYYFSRQKRVFDILLAAFLLVILLPLSGIIAIIVFITTGFPIIFKQKRTGKNGDIFTLYKFRSMQKNASLMKHKYESMNEAPLPMFKIHDDPRFVGIGRFLSRSGLDELPQLWNILKGEMSFVGPRPLPVHEAEALPKEWRNFREQVKPGIFSHWAYSWERHKSLKNWEEQEKKTLKDGSLLQDILLIYAVIISQLVLFTKRKKIF